MTRPLIIADVRVPWLTVALLSLFAPPGVVLARADVVLARLDQAKAVYQTETAKIREAVLATIDRRLEAARNTGPEDLVQNLEAERQAFAEHGDFPAEAAPSLVRKQQALANTLVGTYQAAIRDDKRAGSEADVQRVQRELEKFQEQLTIQATRKLLIGTWHLVVLGVGYETDYVFHADGRCDQVREQLKLQWYIDLPQQRIVVHHPGKPNDASEIIDLPLNPRRTLGKNWRGDQFRLNRK